MVSMAQGVAQKGLYLNQLRAFEIALPSASEQARIGGRLETVSHETLRLAAIYMEKKSKLDTLEQSLLDTALSGQLAACA
jgi:restriction endonuclease S subunit